MPHGNGKNFKSKTPLSQTDQEHFGSSKGIASIIHFCTKVKNLCILGADATYNIGKYYVTLTTYRNLILRNKNGNAPMILYIKASFCLSSCEPELCRQTKILHLLSGKWVGGS